MLRPGKSESARSRARRAPTNGKHEARPGLRELYEPIRGDLDRVEEVLASELSSENPFIGSLIAHSGRFAGKRVRPAMLLLAARVCGGVTQTHVRLGAVVEMLHSATLVHDDVLDEADLRRQVRTLNQSWGNEAAILFGDFLFAKAFTLCARLGCHEANVLLAQTTQEMCEGELAQTSTKFNLAITEAEYIEIIRRKTAALFAAACRLGSVGWEADRRVVDRLGAYGAHFGIAFQIIDDVLDLTGDEREVGKSLGTDLEKGKLTLPVIRLLATRSGRARQELERLLRTGEGAAERRRAVLERLREGDVLPYCMARAEEHLGLAQRSVLELHHPAGEQLARLAEYALKRRS